MICPFCREDNDKVVDTRSSEGGTGIRRRRECLSCGRRFTSFERLEDIPIHVIKRDHRKQPFDIDKLTRSLEIACRKRPITRDQILEVANRIEASIFKKENKEIPSSVIGEYIIDELRDLDSVAYVRFSSVYREYNEVSQFIELIQKMKK